ncbi:MAG TPA: hypothetical protein VFB15_11690 [Candidatus Binataceae bacterium]|nr:hypothetical protein [Candidatus Binataceae bacterium]
MLDFVKTLAANPKTTCAGVAMFAVTIMYLCGHIATSDYLSAVGALTGAGFLLARDGHA